MGSAIVSYPMVARGIIIIQIIITHLEIITTGMKLDQHSVV
jgi:hypothetical protein